MSEMCKTVMVKGGAGFIRSAMARHLTRETESRGVVDKQSYDGYRSRG